MTLAYSLDVDGDRLVVSHLLGVEQRTLHPRPAFARIGEQMLLSERHLFDSEGASSGRHWRRDEPETLAAKERQGLDPRVMHATRRLRRSLTQRGNPDQIRKSTDRGIEFGTRVPYAKYHTDTGDERPRIIRAPVAFDTLQRRQFERTLQRWIMQGFL
jgi:hypothetical protein